MKEEYINFLEEHIKISPINRSLKTKDKQDIKCLVCESVFEGVPADRKNKFKKHGTTGCPTCARRLGRKYDSNLVVDRLINNGYVIHDDYINNKTPITVSRKDCCGRTWKSRPEKLILSNHNCVPCEKDLKYNGKQNIISILKNHAKLEVLDDSLSVYNKQKIKCLCCGNQINAIPFNKFSKFNEHKKPGCNLCTSLYDSEFNTRNDLFKFFKNELKLTLTDKNKPLKEKQNVKCELCGLNQFVTPASKLLNYKKYNKKGCSNCISKEIYENVRIKNIEKIQEKFVIISSVEDFKNTSLITLQNKECGHIFQSRVGNVLHRNVNCPVCAIESHIENLRKANEERRIDFLQNFDNSLYEDYKRNVRYLTEQNYKKYKHIINPTNKQRSRNDAFDNGYQLDHIVSIKYCFLNNIPAEVCSHPSNLNIISSKDNLSKNMYPTDPFPEIFSDYVYGHSVVMDFHNTIINLDMGLEENVKVVSPYYFDFFHPEKNIGIVFHNLNDVKQTITNTKRYLYNIMNKSISENIRTIHVFSDEWKYNKTLVINKIKHILGLSQKNKVYARKCKILNLSSKEKNEFLKKYHIQGNDDSKINLGAFYDNELVSVMTFCKPRIFMIKNKESHNNMDGNWELSRFCTHDKYHVIGVASKLLKYFQTNYDWTEIFSYADLRWTDPHNNVYEKIGFVLTKTNPPAYHYIIDDKRYHRWGFRLQALKGKLDVFDSSKTEYQNMLNAGYDRVWDCGNLKYKIIRV